MKPDKLSIILQRIQAGELFVVNSRRRNGLLLQKPFHMEFAGPGAAVGGSFDQDCESLIPIGNLSLVLPATADERHNALLIRRQWIRLLQQVTENESPEERSQKVLSQFDNYFDPRVIAKLDDAVFADLVGVLPITIRRVRNRQGV